MFQLSYDVIIIWIKHHMINICGTFGCLYTRKYSDRWKTFVTIATLLNSHNDMDHNTHIIYISDFLPFDKNLYMQAPGITLWLKLCRQICTRGDFLRPETCGVTCQNLKLGLNSYTSQLKIDRILDTYIS